MIAANPGEAVAWLWTDTLASLLAEHDGVPFERLAVWVHHPVGHRLDDGQDPLGLARLLLEAEEGERPERAAAG